MWYTNLFIELEKLGNAERAAQMAAYMKDQFPFLGLPTPERKAFIKPFLNKSKTEAIAFDFVQQCWENPYREAQYIGIDYLLYHQKWLLPTDLSFLKKLIIEKSWWDTVDALDGVVGYLVKIYPQLKQTMLAWSKKDNIWLRRIAINFQLKFKAETDSSLLAQVIKNNFGSTEFFINKAIGWSLREYGKTNPEWVRAFLQTYRVQLAPLSLKEASKYISL